MSPYRSKYKAVPTVAEGQKFASKREARRYLELRMLERAGEIQNLECHPVFPMFTYRLSTAETERIGNYTADFTYWDVKQQKQIVEDVKCQATKTTAYRLRKRIVEAQYDFQITEVQ